MNEIELENLRKKYLKKFMLTVLSTVVSFLLIVFAFINIKVFNENVVFILLVLFVISFLSLGTNSKKYENTFKSIFIKNALKNIPDFDIKWKTSYDGCDYYSKDLEDEKQRKLNKKFKEFSKERKFFEDKLSIIIDDSSKILNEFMQLLSKQKQFFSEQDKQNLNELNTKLKKCTKMKQI